MITLVVMVDLAINDDSQSSRVHVRYLYGKKKTAMADVNAEESSLVALEKRFGEPSHYFYPCHPVMARTEAFS